MERRILRKNKLLCIQLAMILFLSLTLTWHPVFGQPTGSISGRVTNAKTLAGISEALVAANGPSHQAQSTNLSGYYEISGLAPGPYTIAVTAPGYVSQSISSFIYPSGSTPRDFQLHFRSVVGKVYDVLESVGIEDANVTVGDISVFTNSTGHYELLDLNDGTHTVSASAPGYATLSQLVTAIAGTTTVKHFGLNPVPVGRIAGTVKDTAKPAQPVNQATVKVSRGTFAKSSLTDQNGQYAIEDVPAWPWWDIDVYKSGYVAQSTNTSVQSGTTTTLDFKLVQFGRINGTVKDQATNQLLSGAVVTAGYAYRNTTNSNGYYTIFVIGGTSYTVTASAPGYADQSQLSGRVDEGKTETLNFLLQSVPPGKIIGSITDYTTGYAIAGAIVTADHYSNTTDIHGNYTLSNLPAWAYTVAVSAQGFIGDNTERTVSSGGSIRADFALNPFTRVHLEPFLNFGNPEQSFNLNVDLSDARYVYGWEVYLWWNPALLEVATISEGSFLKGPFGNRTTQFSSEVYRDEGVAHIRTWSTLATPDSGVSGSGTLALMTFQIKAKGICGIRLTSAMLYDPMGWSVFPDAMIDALFRTLGGDVNNNGIVDPVDLTVCRAAYGSVSGDANWNINVDLDKDRIVSAYDLQYVGKDYGKSV